MRIIKELQVQSYKVTVYFWNEKYLVKFENGSNELTYKIKQTDLTTDADLETFFIDSQILEKTKEAFSKMEDALHAFYEAI